MIAARGAPASQAGDLVALGVCRLAGATRLELATSPVAVQRPEVTSCNFTAPIATLGTLRNPRELLLHPNCTQISPRSELGARRFPPDDNHNDLCVANLRKPSGPNWLLKQDSW